MDIVQLTINYDANRCLGSLIESDSRIEVSDELVKQAIIHNASQCLNRLLPKHDAPAEVSQNLVDDAIRYDSDQCLSVLLGDCESTVYSQLLQVAIDRDAHRCAHYLIHRHCNGEVYISRLLELAIEQNSHRCVVCFTSAHVETSERNSFVEWTLRHDAMDSFRENFNEDVLPCNKDTVSVILLHISCLDWSMKR